MRRQAGPRLEEAGEVLHGGVGSEPRMDFMEGGQIVIVDRPALS